MRPGQIMLVVPPLTATLGKSELEHTAAIMVRACQVLGDRWQPLLLRQIGEVIKADLDLKTEPWHSLSRNPFFRPDHFYSLVERGYAVWGGDPGVAGSTLELTEKAIVAFAKWARPEVSP